MCVSREQHPNVIGNLLILLPPLLNNPHRITAYLRLVVLAFAFQHSVKIGLSRDSPVLTMSIDAAQTVIKIMIERLYPTGNLRFAMEANFVCVSFAAAFLINVNHSSPFIDLADGVWQLLRPELTSLLDATQQEGVIHLVRRLIEVLASEDVSLDGRHTPALYGRFLSTLLGKHTDRCRPGSKAPPGDVSTSIEPPNTYTWPDFTFYGVANSQDTNQIGTVNPVQEEAEMDFSMLHFVQSVARSHLPNDSEQNPFQSHPSTVTPQESWTFLPSWPYRPMRGDETQ